MLRVPASPAQTPQCETKAAVGVQADGDLPRGVQLTLQLYGAAQGTCGCMRHLWEWRKSLLSDVRLLHSQLCTQLQTTKHHSVFPASPQELNNTQEEAH